MQITLEQVYERLQEFRDQSQKEMKEFRQETQKDIKELRQEIQKDMKELRQDMDGKFASMRTWVVSLFIGTLVLTSAMVGVFINAVMILLQQTGT